MLKHWTIASSLCWLTALACFASPLASSVFTGYIYNYEANIVTGSRDFKLTAKAHLELVYASSTTEAAGGGGGGGEGHLFRLRLTEPVFYAGQTQPLMIDRRQTNLHNPDHDLYAHIVTLTNGTAYIKQLYTHRADTATFKNIKKSILLNLLPTNHHLNKPLSTTTTTATSNSQQVEDGFFIDDNNIAQPELFSPDSISQVTINAIPRAKSTRGETTTTTNGAANRALTNSIHENDLDDASPQYSNQLPAIFESIEGFQNVTFKSRVFSEAQSNLTTNFQLKLVNELKSSEHEKFDKATSIKEAISLLPDKPNYQADTIDLQRERKICTHHHCNRNLPQLFQDYDEFLSDQSMASVEAAVAFLRLLERLRVAQGSSVKDILQILKKTKRNQGIESSILDILAAARTKDSILAALKYLKLPKNRNLDISERFLSVLSVAAKTTSKMQLRRPLKSPYYFTGTAALKRGEQLREQESKLASIEFVAEELLQIIKSTPSEKWASKKLRWSTLLTLATLVNANIVDNNLDFDYGNELNQKVSKLLLEELQLCHEDDTDCRIVLLQAIGNVGILSGQEQFKVLREQVLNSGRRESISAMRVLRDLLQNQPKDKPLKDFDYVQLKDLLLRVVYDNMKETTARVLAAEMIVRFVPSHLASKELLLHLPSFNNNELATMIYSRMQSLKPDSLANYNDNWYWKACIINGTSASFVKTMARTDSLNASYGVNVELMNKGKVLKESSFDVFLDTKKKTQDLFSLGIFARGLSSFAGGGGADESGEDENESTMAGMTLRLLGGYLRPYVFFTGTGELMSHIWSGTASEPTTAFNGNLLLIDHDEGYPLISGFVAEQQMRGVLSIDVTGKVKISLWHRSSHSVVRTKAAIIVQASQSIYTGYDRLWQTELFSFGGQALVDFVADSDFSSSPPRICLQVTQPEFLVRINARSREQMMTDEVRRKITRKNYSIGAKSYSLNTENNKMCSLMNDEL